MRQLMQVVRSVLVLMIAYYAIGTVVNILDSGLQAVFPGSQPNSTTGQIPGPGWLLWHIVEIGMITVASAYCAALMVGRAELLHVSILGAWMLLVGVGTYAAMGDRWPEWFRLGLAVVPVPAVLLGGCLRIWQRRKQAGKGETTRPRHIVRRAVLWGIVLALLLGAHFYQTDPYYRHVSIRQVFWFFELPILVGVGAGLGYFVGRWRRAKYARETIESPGQTGT